MSGQMHNTTVAHLFGFTYSPKIILMSLIVTSLIIVIAIFSVRRLSLIPSGLQNVFEILVEFIQNALRNAMGDRGIKYSYFFGSLFIYILVANTIGLVPGFVSPTKDVSVTICLAALVILWIQIISIKENGILSYFKHYVQPNPVFLILHLIELFTRPLTLALRLFGNIFAGEVLLEVLTRIAYPPLPAVWLLFSLAIGAIQAYIFTLISIAYTGLAVGEDEVHN